MNTPEGVAQLKVLEEKFEALHNDVAEISRSTKALVEAWNTATGIVKFVKFLSTLVAAISALWLFLSHGFKTP